MFSIQNTDPLQAALYLVWVSELVYEEVTVVSRLLLQLLPAVGRHSLQLRALAAATVVADALVLLAVGWLLVSAAAGTHSSAFCEVVKMKKPFHGSIGNY
jgi:hypothetical protein